ncbi:MAG: hypothetical protein ABW321_11390 [Polyangiales bacterium]
MARIDALLSLGGRSGLRSLVTVLEVLLLTPVFAVLVAPLALLLMPLVWLAIPFLIVKLLNRSMLAAGSAPALSHATPLIAAHSRV